jgi:DNA polymerase
MIAPTSPFAAELSAALQWWQMAGVDSDFCDDATDWLGPSDAELAEQAAAEKRSQSASANTPQKQAADLAAEQEQKKSLQRADLLGDSPPSDLKTFRQWWLETPGIDAIGPRGRIAPRGPANAKLMVLMIDPEERDGERLLSGPQGQLLSRMLSAMGIDEESVYIASALPRHTPMADTGALAAGGMDAVTLHHIGLASPQKLVAFGSGILPLIGQKLSQSDTYLREINPNAQKVPVLMSEGLDSLMAMPRLKARFWRRWMEWSAE